MSYSYYPCSDYEVDDTLVQEVCPEEHAAFVAILAEQGNDLKDGARALRTEHYGDIAFEGPLGAFHTYASRIEAALDVLTKRFLKATDLEIYLTAQGETVGEFDDARDFYWRVKKSSILRSTEAGKKFATHIHEIAWVEAG